VVIQVSEERSQARNRDIARERLTDLIRRATEKPKKRIKTRVSASQKRKRMEAKKRRGEVKTLRGQADGDDWALSQLGQNLWNVWRRRASASSPFWPLSIYSSIPRLSGFGIAWLSRVVSCGIVQRCCMDRNTVIHSFASAGQRRSAVRTETTVSWLTWTSRHFIYFTDTTNYKGFKNERHHFGMPCTRELLAVPTVTTKHECIRPDTFISNRAALAAS